MLELRSPVFALAIAMSLTFAVLSVPGCYSSHEREEPVDTTCDPIPRPVCVRRADPCTAPLRVAATCGDDDEWHCVDSSPYAPAWGGVRCLPLLGEVSAVPEAPLPVVVSGRCAWLLGHVVDADGREHRNVLVEIPETCEEATWSDAPRPAISTPDDADILSAQAAFADARGDTRLLVRGWAFDASGGFGVVDRGVGLALFEADRATLTDGWLFAPSVDLGDAALAWEGHAYAYGCPGTPEWIEEDCFVGRAPLDAVDDPAAWELWSGVGWGAGVEPQRVFGSGPHRGPVFEDPRGTGLVHIYAVGFGSRIEMTRAARPEGPWGASRVAIECELPDGDPGAYCAGPSVHLELWDPTQASTFWIGYSIGTTSSDGAERRARDPEGYWTRLVRVTLP